MLAWWRKQPKAWPTLVKATCPSCGDVTVRAEHVVVSVTAITATLICPLCDNGVVVLLNNASALLLMQNGAEVIV